MQQPDGVVGPPIGSLRRGRTSCTVSCMVCRVQETGDRHGRRAVQTRRPITRDASSYRPRDVTACTLPRSEMTTSSLLKSCSIAAGLSPLKS